MIQRSAPIPHRKLQLGRGDALLIIDAINDLEFRGAQGVAPWAKKMVSPLLKLRAKAHRAAIPIIYVNDNFGLWHSNFEEVQAHCMRPSARGREITRRLRPTRKDFFVLKPRHSGFFATALEPLLQHLKIKRLTLAGIATNLCVLFTAHDAHMLNYRLIILSDCCAAESDFDHNVALTQLERFCRAQIRRSDELRFT